MRCQLHHLTEEAWKCYLFLLKPRNWCSAMPRAQIQCGKLTATTCRTLRTRIARCSSTCCGTFVLRAPSAVICRHKILRFDLLVGTAGLSLLTESNAINLRKSPFCAVSRIKQFSYHVTLKRSDDDHANCALASFTM